MNRTIKDIVESYIYEPDKRLLCRISDNTKFIEHLKEMTKHKHSVKVDKDSAIKFMALLAEEELRRYKIQLDDNSDLELYIAKVLNIDMHKYVVDYIDNINDEMLNSNINIETYYENKIKAVLQINSEDILDYNYNIDELSEEARKLFVIYKLVFHKKILPLLKLSSFITDDKLSFNNLKSFRIDNNYKMMTLIIQNRVNSSDKKMLQSIKDLEYSDYLDEYEEYIQEVTKKIIKSKREYMIDKMTDIQSEYNLKEILNLFKETKNLNIIAGILKGLSTDDILFKDIINLLQNEDCVYSKQKIHMLKKGKYLSIKLLHNLWDPDTKILRNLIKNNMDKIIKTDWINIFPNKISCISNIYYNINNRPSYIA